LHRLRLRGRRGPRPQPRQLGGGGSARSYSTYRTINYTVRHRTARHHAIPKPKIAFHHAIPQPKIAWHHAIPQPKIVTYRNYSMTGYRG